MKTTLLANCRLIPALSGNYTGGNADVLIRGETIEAVVPTGQKVPLEVDERCDCGGKTLLPGLHDIHTTQRSTVMASSGWTTSS